MLVTVEVDDIDLTERLAETGDLDPMLDDDPDEVRRAMNRMLERWLIESPGHA
jgi:hypothetical protein